MLLKDLFVFLPKSKRNASYGKLEGKYPFFTSSNTIDKYVDEPDYNGSYLIIGDGGTGNCKYYDGEFSASDHNYIMFPKKGTNPHCVQYFLAKDNFQVLNEGFKGIGIKNVSKAYIENIDYRHNQKFSEDYICQTLGKIEELISKELSVLTLLDELTKSRFNELFPEDGDFEHDTLSGVTTKITDGSHNPPKGVTFSEYIMASSQNVNDVLNLNDVRYLSKEDFDRENKRTDIQEGDVLFTIVGTIGRTYVIKSEKIVFQRSVAVIKPKKNIINSIYLKYFLSSDFATKQIDIVAHGVAQKGIYLSNLKELDIVVPKIEVQDKFASFVESVDKLKFSRLVENCMFFSSKNMVLEALA